MTEPTCNAPGCERPATTRSGMCQQCWRHEYYLAHREQCMAASNAWRKANPAASAAIAERGRIAKAEQSKVYRRLNADKIKAKRAADADSKKAYHLVYNAANQDKIKAYRKVYLETHREQQRVKNAAKYAANREQSKVLSKAYRAANREKTAELNKAWKSANHKRVRELGRQQNARRRAWEAGAIVTKTDYAAILAEFGMVCHICDGDIPDRVRLEFDHVIPLSKGGAHSPENIRPSHKSCNRSKGNRVPLHL